MNYEATIGLEAHVQLKTNTKIVCGCAKEVSAH
jgi:Asp-tRNA(Asn)/Glu-tRNA(Gln) amidotransferase B subunit